MTDLFVCYTANGDKLGSRNGRHGEKTEGERERLEGLSGSGGKRRPDKLLISEFCLGTDPVIGVGCIHTQLLRVHI